MLIKKSHQNSKRGQGLAEYALILFFIFLAVFAAVIALGIGVNGLWQAILAAWP